MSLISEATNEQLWQENHSKLNETKVKLRTYSGEMLKVLGSIIVDADYEAQKAQMPLLAVAGTVLFGKTGC